MDISVDIAWILQPGTKTVNIFFSTVKETPRWWCEQNSFSVWRALGVTSVCWNNPFPLDDATCSQQLNNSRTFCCAEDKELMVFCVPPCFWHCVIEWPGGTGHRKAVWFHCLACTCDKWLVAGTRCPLRRSPSPSCTWTATLWSSTNQRPYL